MIATILRLSSIWSELAEETSASILNMLGLPELGELVLIYISNMAGSFPVPEVEQVTTMITNEGGQVMEINKVFLPFR